MNNCKVLRKEKMIGLSGPRTGPWNQPQMINQLGICQHLGRGWGRMQASLQTPTLPLWPNTAGVQWALLKRSEALNNYWIHIETSFGPKYKCSIIVAHSLLRLQAQDTKTETKIDFIVCLWQVKCRGKVCYFLLLYHFCIDDHIPKCIYECAKKDPSGLDASLRCALHFCPYD